MTGSHRTDPMTRDCDLFCLFLFYTVVDIGRHCPIGVTFGIFAIPLLPVAAKEESKLASVSMQHRHNDLPAPRPDSFHEEIRKANNCQSICSTAPFEGATIDYLSATFIRGSSYHTSN
ncbi:hypothetical protein MN608_04979 [Microdochium nivale]|nr:hypothetical protein MN608_04979 [Microdochium nivale]